MCFLHVLTFLKCVYVESYKKKNQIKWVGKESQNHFSSEFEMEMYL